MTQRYQVTVVDKILNDWSVEVHQADSWQSAVLSHSLLGAEFEDLKDLEDLQSRAFYYGYTITVEDLRDVQS